MRQRARIVLLAAAGMKTRRDWPRRLAARPARRRSGGFAMPSSGWRGSMRPGDRGRGAEVHGARRASASWRCWISRRRRAMRRWTGPLLAAALGDVDVQYVWRFLRAQKIDLAGRKSWCESNDPEFVAKAADVVGLYMAPPENAIVICVDEKPSIQALERAQGYLKLPNGRALTGHSHDYKRNGTSTLFAAFEVATGKVTSGT